MRQEISSRTQVAAACLGLFIASLFLTAYSAKNPGVARVGSTLVLKITAPFNGLINASWDSCSGAWNSYVNLIGTSKENSALKGKLDELEGRVSLVNELERENSRLRELLRFSSERQLSGVTASVIGGDASGWVKGITVNKGSLEGVSPGMSVLHPRGVVGQVVSVSSNSARVLLVSDHASGVDVLTQESRARGVVEGAGERVCELKFIPKEFQIKEGEQVLTSGMDGVYPKGVLVGTVSQISAGTAGLFKTVEVKPAVDLTRIEEVLIVFPNASAQGVSADAEAGVR
jgi:rod shape-determining protein MreC